MSTTTLRELAAAALAEKLAAMGPVEKIEHDDPDGSRRRWNESVARYRHAQEMIGRSPVKKWFPDVEWLLDATPDYPRNSVVLRDAWDESRPVRDQPHLMVQWTEATPEDPEVTYKVSVTYGPMTDTDTGYPYWPEGTPVHSAADVGAVLDRVAKRQRR